MSGRAFGKLILLGEHTVVYGAPALVAGIQRGVEARAEVTDASGHELKLLDTEVMADPEGEPLAQAYHALVEAGGACDGLSLVLRGDLPAGVGLGFSAAAGVALARAIELLAGDEVDEQRVRARAMAWERVFHGNPSGVDVAAAMAGGCARFVRGEGATKVAVRTPLALSVGLTGSPGSTRAMVDAVAELRGRRPELVERSIDAVAALVDNAISAVQVGDHEALGELMNLNQMLLAGLLVSTDSIEDLVGIARDVGALGAKLTGAGGGGAVVALASDAAGADAIVAAWRDNGYDGFTTEVGRA